MKKKLLYIVLVLMFGCNQAEKSQSSKTIENEEVTHTLTDSIQELGFGEAKNDKFIENIDGDCIFDQKTQTDEFLKDIKELEGYVWDQESKTAEIVLNDHWSLSIYRGGCDLFYITATFYYDRQLIFKKDKDVINEYIIWIVNLLEDFSSSNTIKETIENNKISITTEGENKLFVNFMDVKVYESYIMNFESEADYTKFSISNIKG